MPKALNAEQARVLTDIPNIGKSMADDLRSLGIQTPAQVRVMDPQATYEQLRDPMHGQAPRSLRAGHLSGGA